MVFLHPLPGAFQMYKNTLSFPTQHTWLSWCSALQQKPDMNRTKAFERETHVYNVVFELDVKAVARQGDDNLFCLFHILHTLTVQHRERDLHTTITHPMIKIERWTNVFNTSPPSVGVILPADVPFPHLDSQPLDWAAPLRPETHTHTINTLFLKIHSH